MKICKYILSLQRVPIFRISTLRLNDILPFLPHAPWAFLFFSHGWQCRRRSRCMWRQHLRYAMLNRRFRQGCPSLWQLTIPDDGNFLTNVSRHHFEHTGVFRHGVPVSEDSWGIHTWVTWHLVEKFPFHWRMDPNWIWESHLGLDHGSVEQTCHFILLWKYWRCFPSPLCN